MNKKIKTLFTTKFGLLFLLACATIVVMIWFSVLWVGHNFLIIPKAEFDRTYAGVSSPRLAELPVEAQIRRIFGSDAKMALAISQAENGTRQCDREGKTKDHGIFQINQVHLNRWTIEQLKDCTENIKIAHLLFHEQGWTPWVAYTNGSYKKYLSN